MTLTSDSKGSMSRVRGLPIVHARVIMKLKAREFREATRLTMCSEAHGITNNAVCYMKQLGFSLGGESKTEHKRTIVEPTATLMLSDNSSLTETLTAVIHSEMVSAIENERI